jgi:hypothetical protein
MYRIANLFLRAVLVLVGIGALAFLIWEPQIEGRNVHATQFQIYLQDPFLAYAYMASIPFFAALWQGLRWLGLAGRGQPFSPASLKALGTIRLCALAVIAFAVAGEVLFILFNESDDRAGGVFMGGLICFVSLTMAAGATVLEGIVNAGADRAAAGSFVQSG